MSTPLEVEFRENLNRVDNLIEAHRQLEEHDLGAVETRLDVLRAAVVMMHSCLEEIIRNLFLFKLPSGSVETLNKIPFMKHESSHRPKPILLGELSELRGKFIDNIIRESIDAYVNTMNLNNIAQLCECLRMADVGVEKFRSQFSNLEAMMARRHQIAHQMDRADDMELTNGPITSISLGTVESWREALSRFGELLVNEVT